MKVPFIKIIDRFMGCVILLSLSIISRKKDLKKEKYDKILLIQLWGIGETILTLPAITELEKKHKESDIIILCTERNRQVYDSILMKTKIISLNPISIIVFILRNFRKYDLVIDMEEYLNISSIISFFLSKNRVGYSHGLRSRLYNIDVNYNDKQHVVNTFLDLLEPIGIKEKDLDIPKLKYDRESERNIDKIIGEKKGKKIGIVPGAAESAKARMWPMRRFVSLSQKLIDKKFNLIFIGSGGEIEYNQKIIQSLDPKYVTDTTGKISLKELFCLVDKIDLLITNDTGPLHIASAQKTKIIGLFGPNTPVRFGPYKVENVAYYKKDICKYSPCINVHKGEVPDCLYSKKTKDYQKCMKAISVDEVIASVDKLI